MHLLRIVFFSALLFDIILAELESCLKEYDHPKICFVDKEGYVDPFPLVLNTILHLREIVAINEEENSVSIQVNLYSFWKDPGLDRSNGTKL